MDTRCGHRAHPDTCALIIDQLRDKPADFFQLADAVRRSDTTYEDRIAYLLCALDRLLEEGIIEKRGGCFFLTEQSQNR